MQRKIVRHVYKYVFKKRQKKYNNWMSRMYIRHYIFFVRDI